MNLGFFFDPGGKTVGAVGLTCFICCRSHPSLLYRVAVRGMIVEVKKFQGPKEPNHLLQLPDRPQAWAQSVSFSPIYYIRSL